MNLQGPNISVIIPSFNRAETLTRAIQSVLGQTYQNFELLIIDDGSSDDTRHVVEKYPQLIYHYQDNQGVSCARNIGCHMAKGEWIAFLDSDDEWLPTKLEQQCRFILEHPKISCVHGEEIWIRNGKRVNPKKKHQKGGGDQFISSLELCLISPSTVMLRKDVLFSLGLFREDFTVCEDYDLWLKLTSRYEVGFISEPLIRKYGGHTDQLSQKYKAMDYYRVKSIDWVLRNLELTELKKQKAMEVLRTKCEILLRGYIKHNNLAHYEEVKSILQSY